VGTVGKPDVVLIPGLASSKAVWDGEAKLLAPNYRLHVVQIDGFAGAPAGPNATGAFLVPVVEELHAYIVATKIHPAVMGHSLGGLISLELALMAKPRVRSLTLLNTFADGAGATRMTLRLLWISLRLRFAPRRMRRDAFMELVVAPGDDNAKVEGLAERLTRVFGHDIADLPPISQQQLSALGAHDVTTRLGELSGIPTLVISSEKDLIARPELGRAIASGIPGARYLEIPGASHAFPILEAERCAALIMEHLSGAEARRAG